MPIKPQRRFRISLALATCVMGVSLLTGCVKDRPATTQPIATDIDPATANPQYWLEKPAVASVPGGNFDQLLAACQDTIRARRFEIERTDYRGGLVVSRPLVSKQFWEFWRGDVVDKHSLEASSLATYRRTVRWQITKSEDGKYSASPKVVVEHFTAPDRRISGAVNYRQSLNEAQTDVSLNPRRAGTTSLEPNWYAVGRDSALERQLAMDLQQTLNRH